MLKVRHRGRCWALSLEVVVLQAIPARFARATGSTPLASVPRQAEGGTFVGNGNGVDDDPDAAFAVDPATVGRDLVVAQKAMLIHRPEHWPTGKFCINCHARWPCRLCRWGVAVLEANGWTADDMTNLVRRARAT